MQAVQAASSCPIPGSDACTYLMGTRGLSSQGQEPINTTKPAKRWGVRERSCYVNATVYE